MLFLVGNLLVPITALKNLHLTDFCNQLITYIFGWHFYTYNYTPLRTCTSIYIVLSSLTKEDYIVSLFYLLPDVLLW